MGGAKEMDAARLRSWVVLLAIAEAIGLAAVALAAHLGHVLVPDPVGAGPTAAAIGIATAGGVVEGVAVGLVMGRLLNRTVRALSVTRWTILTAVVAGLGWAGGSLPSVLAGAGRSPEPPLAWVLVSALVAGLGFGALLGWVQSVLLRQRVSHPRRWIAVSVLAWAPTLVIVFAGALTADESWPAPAVVGLAAGTGALSGAVLGLMLGWLTPVLTGPSVLGRILLTAMATRLRRRVIPGGLVGLKVRGNRTGQWHALPVMAARDGAAYVVLPGNPQSKRWWRNLDRPSRVQLLVGGRWEPADGWVLGPRDRAYPTSIAAYRRRYPKVVIPTDAPLVRVLPAPRAATDDAPSVLIKGTG